MRTALFAATLAVSLLVALPGFATPPNGHPQGKHGSETSVTEECDGGTVTYDGPETMWPPNHKYRDLTVTAVADDDGDTVTLTTNGTHDEYLTPDDAENSEEMNGAGNTEADISPYAATDNGTGSAQTTHSVRGERSGRGDGRTYTIGFLATFGESECIGSFTIEVPHSQGRSAENKRVHEPGDNGNNGDDD